MGIIQGKEYNDYCNFTAGYNDYAPEDLFRFSSFSGLVLNTEKISKEFSITEQNEEYKEYNTEM